METERRPFFYKVSLGFFHYWWYIRVVFFGSLQKLCQYFKVCIDSGRWWTTQYHMNSHKNMFGWESGGGGLCKVMYITFISLRLSTLSHVLYETLWSLFNTAWHQWLTPGTSQLTPFHRRLPWEPELVLSTRHLTERQAVCTEDAGFCRWHITSWGAWKKKSGPPEARPGRSSSPRPSGWFPRRTLSLRARRIG